MFMIPIYIGLIVGKRYTIANVPDHLKDLVMADLTAMGFDGEGNPVQP